MAKLEEGGSIALKKKHWANGIQLKSLKHNWFFSTKQLHGLVFTGKHPTKKKQKTSVCLGFYWIHGSWYYHTVWRLSYQQSLHYRKVLRHQTTWKTIGVCWAFYNAHTWTGNRLLNSTQPPMHDSNSSGTETILTPTQSQCFFLICATTESVVHTREPQQTFDATPLLLKWISLTLQVLLVKRIKIMHLYSFLKCYQFWVGPK